MSPRIDVVLDEYRDAVHRPPQGASLALGVQLVGDGERIRVELDDRVDLAGPDIQLVDAIEVELGNPPGRPGPLGHATLQGGDGDFFQFERGSERGPSSQQGPGAPAPDTGEGRDAGGADHKEISAAQIGLGHTGRRGWGKPLQTPEDSRAVGR